MSEPDSSEVAPVGVEPPPVIPYATPAPSNQAAVLSIVLGVLVFVPLLGLATIYFARRGLAAARQGAGRERMARTGYILGIVNLVLSLTGLVALPPAWISARRAALQTQCMSNLRQIAMVQLMYASQSRGSFPPTFDDLAGAMVTFTNAAAAPTLLTCPACAGDASKKPVTVGTKASSNYIFSPPPASMPRLRNAQRTVMAYEPLSNHNGRGSAFLFYDGHVEWHNAASATGIIAELQAGQNPPPSIR